MKPVSQRTGNSSDRFLPSSLFPYMVLSVASFSFLFSRRYLSRVLAISTSPPPPPPPPPPSSSSSSPSFSFLFSVLSSWFFPFFFRPLPFARIHSRLCQSRGKEETSRVQLKISPTPRPLAFYPLPLFLLAFSCSSFLVVGNGGPRTPALLAPRRACLPACLPRRNETKRNEKGDTFTPSPFCGRLLLSSSLRGSTPFPCFRRPRWFAREENMYNLLLSLSLGKPATVVPRSPIHV